PSPMALGMSSDAAGDAPAVAPVVCAGPPPVGATDGLPPPQAPAISATTASMPPSFRWNMTPPLSALRRRLLDAAHVLSLPDQPHGTPLCGQHLHRRCMQVLLRDDQLGAGVERHDVARVRPQVHDVADGAIGPDLAVGHRRTGLGDADLLR